MNRIDAGQQLAAALWRYRDKKPIVIALPRGGVPVAAEVARTLRAPLDLVLVRKLGVPMQPEVAMGAVVDGIRPMTVRNEDVIAAAGISEKTFEEARSRELQEIARRHACYFGDRPQLSVLDRIVIVVDDGIATGATVKAALRALRQRGPAELVLAVPVAPADSLAALRSECDDVVCLETHTHFYSIAFYYSDFHQLGDTDVTDVLAEFRSPQSYQSD